MKLDPQGFELRLPDHLERQESRALSWGIVDSAWSEDSLRDEFKAFRSKLTDAEKSVVGSRKDLLDALIECQLVVQVSEDGDPLYRTRMAETMRLLARFFKTNLSKQTMAWGTDLVSDYRLLVRQCLPSPQSADG